MKRTIRLRESELRRMIAESVKRVLNEVDVKRGSTTFRHYEPVPYDDDYIERHGNNEPSWDDEPEKREEINTATFSLTQRIEKALANIMDEQDFMVTIQENNNPYEKSNGEIRDLFSAQLFVNMYNRRLFGKAASIVMKILSYSELVRDFEFSGTKGSGLSFYLVLDTNKIGKERMLGRDSVKFQ